MNDWSQGDWVSKSMHGRNTLKHSWKAYCIIVWLSSLICINHVFVVHSVLIHLGLLIFQHHHLLSCEPTFSSSPHLEPEGNLLVFHFMKSLRRKSCNHLEKMSPANTVTDRLPWLSYHSADAVHSKGTVLW